MPTPELAIDTLPRPDPLLPFASETGLQRFVQLHARAMLGLNVLASTVRGGRRLFNVDILAVDDSGVPVVIECKLDAVDHSTFEQLAEYKHAFDWGLFEERSRAMGFQAKRAEPLLVAIGYRFKVIDSAIVCLSYAYHGVDITKEPIRERQAGAVSLGHATSDSRAAHPRVDKKVSIDERLQRDAPRLQHSFWTVDGGLASDPGLAPRYSGKDYVNYRAHGRVVARAAIGDGNIQFQVGRSQPVTLREAADASLVLAECRRQLHELRIG
jgi:hypothetical protein